MNKPTYKNNDYVGFLTIEEAGQRYRLSRRTLNKVAIEAGAMVRIGRQIVRYDSEKLDAFLRGQTNNERISKAIAEFRSATGVSEGGIVELLIREGKYDVGTDQRQDEVDTNTVHGD